MGCDIHAYVETRETGEDKEWGCQGCLQGYTTRDYLMFSFLAGVRNHDHSVEPVVMPRGFPREASWWVTGEYTLLTRYENAANVRGWLQNGYSQPYDKKRITNPDWHTPSWVTPDELELVLAQYLCNTSHGKNMVYVALLAQMQVWQAAGFEVRLVFWFDN